MLQRFDLIRKEMERLEEKWSWSFGYAPLPGRSRIKVTAQSKEEPGKTKVLFVGAAVFEQMPAENLTQLLSILLQAEPETFTMDTPAPQSQPLCDTYDALRGFYRARLDDLRNQHAQWLLRHHRRKFLSNPFLKRPVAR